MFNLNSIGFQYQLNSLLIVSNEKFKSFHIQFEFNWISISIQLNADPIQLKPRLSFFSLLFVSIRNKVRRSALFHRPQKYFFLRSWDLVQEDAAAPAKPLLLHRALLLGRVDLYDHRLPGGLDHYVPARKVPRWPDLFKQPHYFFPSNGLTTNLICRPTPFTLKQVFQDNFCILKSSNW